MFGPNVARSRLVAVVVGGLQLKKINESVIIRKSEKKRHGKKKKTTWAYKKLPAVASRLRSRFATHN